MKVDDAIAIARAILVTILVITLCYVANDKAQAQSAIGVEISQDAKLALAGDEKHGLDAGTLNLYVKINMQGKQTDSGYLVVAPSFEYAELQIVPYRRWAVNVGYTFNQLTIKNLEMGTSLSYGFIDRGLTNFSWGLDFYTKWKLCDRAKIVATVQNIQRSDLGLLYGTPAIDSIRSSGFVGIEINLN